MPNPWLAVPLEDYEGHMRSGPVQQLAALSELFARALEWAKPASVAVLGVAGGNGLERIDPGVTARIVGFDINARYLDQVRQRFALPGLELHCVDLAEEDVTAAPADLVHAALIFEHAGVGRALDNAVALTGRKGALSVVLQMPSPDQEGVTPTPYQSIQKLKDNFELIERDPFSRLMEDRGFRLAAEDLRRLPSGKSFWLGLFTRSETEPRPRGSVGATSQRQH